MKGRHGFGKASFGDGVPGPLLSLAWVPWSFPFLASSTQTLEGEAAGARAVIRTDSPLPSFPVCSSGSGGGRAVEVPAGPVPAPLLMRALPPQVRKALRVPAPVAEHSDDPHHAADAEALHRGPGGQRVEH